MNCSVIFEKRTEFPIEVLPMFLNRKYNLPTDYETLSGYCEAVEEMTACFGKDYINNCVNKYKVADFLITRNSNYPLIFTADRILCPSKNNNVTFEAFGCLLNISRYMDTEHYVCENAGKFLQINELSMEKVVLCQLIAIYKRCGEAMSNILCEIYQSKDIATLLNWSVGDQSCDSYMNEECRCFKYQRIW